MWVGEGTIVRCKCVICAEVFPKTNMTALLCGHVFHGECIQRWFEHTDTPTCPNCGVSVNTEQIVRRLFFSATDDLDDLDDTTLIDELLEKIDILEDENNNLNRRLDEAEHRQRQLQEELEEEESNVAKLTEELNSIEEQLRVSKKMDNDLGALVKSVREMLKVFDKREADMEMLTKVQNTACTTLRSVEEHLENLETKETNSGTS